MRALADALRNALTQRRRVVLAGVALALASIGTAAGALLGGAPDPCAGVDAPIDAVWPRADASTAIPREHAEAYAQTWRSARRDACEATMVRGEQSPMLMEIRGACLEQRLVGFSTLLEGIADGLPAEDAASLIDDARTALDFCSDSATLLTNDGNRFARVTDRSRGVGTEAAWVAGSERLERARALALLGHSSEARALAQAVAADAHHLGLRGIEAEALLEWAAAELAAGELDGPGPRLDRAAELAIAAGHHKVAFDAMLGSVQLALSRGAATVADDVRLRFAEALLERIGSDDPRRVRLLELRGLTADAAGDPIEAEASLAAAVQLADVAYPDDHPNAISPRNNLAAVALARGEYDRADALWSAVLDHAVSRLGETHPDAVAPAFNLGVVALSRGDAQRAVEWFALAQRRWSASVGPGHPLVGLALGARGEALRQLGRLAAARAVQSEALTIRERALGAEHPDVAASLEELAAIDRREGAWSSAHERIDRALAIREAVQGSQHVDLAIALGIRGELLCDQGRAAEAIAPLSRALLLRARPGLDPARSLELHAVAVRALVEAAVSPSPRRRADRGSTPPNPRRRRA